MQIIASPEHLDGLLTLKPMRDIYAKLREWQKSGRRTAIATVAKTWRSSPRQAGASMIVSDTMEIFGSVSGGCVEGAVAKEAINVIAEGRGKMLSYGVSNEKAWEVGLSCGGGIKVFVRPFDAVHGLPDTLEPTLSKVVSGDGSITMITPIDDSAQASGWYTDHEENFPETWAMDLIDMVRDVHQGGRSAIFEHGGNTYFAHVVPKRRQLLIIGAAHITMDLLRLAAQLNFSPRVIDPRGLFTESIQGLCPPDRLHRAWPADILPSLLLDDNCYAVLLTHDPKIDDQALHILLKSEVRYIGALGSSKTHRRRVERLEIAGFNSDEIGRIYTPVGLNVGAISPAEIALSIAAEMTAVSNRIDSTASS